MNFDELNQCFVVYLGRLVGRLSTGYGCFGLIGMFVAYSVSLFFFFPETSSTGIYDSCIYYYGATGYIVCIQIQSICKRIPNTLSRRV